LFAWPTVSGAEGSIGTVKAVNEWIVHLVE
jgi:hypothetical protein